MARWINFHADRVCVVVREHKATRIRHFKDVRCLHVHERKVRWINLHADIVYMLMRIRQGEDHYTPIVCACSWAQGHAVEFAG